MAEVVSAADFKKYPPAVVGKLIDGRIHQASIHSTVTQIGG